MWKSFSRKIFPHCSNISNLESLKTKRAAHSKIKCIKAQLSAAVHPKDITNTTRSKTHKSYCNKWRGEKKEKGENSRISTTDVLQMLVLQNIVSFLPRLDLFCRCCFFLLPLLCWANHEPHWNAYLTQKNCIMWPFLLWKAYLPRSLCCWIRHRWRMGINKKLINLAQLEMENHRPQIDKPLSEP